MEVEDQMTSIEFKVFKPSDDSYEKHFVAEKSGDSDCSYCYTSDVTDFVADLLSRGKRVVVRHGILLITDKDD